MLIAPQNIWKRRKQLVNATRFAKNKLDVGDSSTPNNYYVPIDTELGKIAKDKRQILSGYHRTNISLTGSKESWSYTILLFSALYTDITLTFNIIWLSLINKC